MNGEPVRGRGGSDDVHGGPAGGGGDRVSGDVHGPSGGDRRDTGDGSVRRDRFEPGEADRGAPGQHLLERPALRPPADAARDRLRSFRAAAAAIAWIPRSWVRPAGSEARWEQRAGRGSISSASRTEGTSGGGRKQPQDRYGARKTQGQSGTSGTGQ